jgi:DNA-binding Xre family transcriptional regulator
MPRLSLENVGLKITKKRGENGVRATAKLIGISPATLLRIEKGHLPDLDTFRKVCEWLEVNPGDVLGSKVSSGSNHRTVAHFKKDKTLNEDMAKALGKMIMAAQRAMEIEEELT